MMEDNAGWMDKMKQAFRKIAKFLMRAFEPGLTWSARLLHGVKALAAVGVVLLVLLCGYTVMLIPSTPDVSDLRQAKADHPSQLMSADGKVLATYSQWNGEWVPLDRISPNVVKALIATEDHRFYDHHGIDVFRTVSSAIWTIFGRQQGGSTITQQLARNRYPQEIGRSRSINRKLKELITALKIEYKYSKKQILETYLNTVPFYYNAHGIEMAARIYFDKPAAKLDILESATLIGMLKGSSYYNPVTNPERALQRRNVVLAQMVKRDALKQSQYDRLKDSKLVLNFDRNAGIHGTAPHFAQHVFKWLVDWADDHDLNVYTDGLIVYTTIDSRMQSKANLAVKRQMEKLQAIADVEWATRSGNQVQKGANAYQTARQRAEPFSYFWSSKKDLVDAFITESDAYRAAVDGGEKADAALARLRSDEKFMARLRAEKTRLQAGLLVMDPRTGYVKAWVGSRDYGTDQFDHVARAQRQPGSTFKPFVYGAALEQGIPPDKTYIEQAVEIKLGDGTVWRPTDMTSEIGREMTLREGLIHSKNTITAQVMQEVGPSKVASFARRMGVNQSKLDAVPSLALGTSPVTLLEMVSAYSTLASGGEYRKPVYITRVTDRKGRELLRFDSRGERVLSEAVAANLNEMMRGVVREGTGTRLQSEFGVRANVGGKTGTTQKNTDGWFIMTHPRLVAGAWVGFNDSRIAMRSSYWGQGGHNALNIVGDFAKETMYAKGGLSSEYEVATPNLLDSAVQKLTDMLGLGASATAEQKAAAEAQAKGLSPDAAKEARSPTMAPPVSDKKPGERKNDPAPNNAVLREDKED